MDSKTTNYVLAGLNVIVFVVLIIVFSLSREKQLLTGSNATSDEIFERKIAPRLAKQVLGSGQTKLCRITVFFPDSSLAAAVEYGETFLTELGADSSKISFIALIFSNTVNEESTISIIRNNFVVLRDDRGEIRKNFQGCAGYTLIIDTNGPGVTKETTVLFEPQILAEIVEKEILCSKNGI